MGARREWIGRSAGQSAAKGALALAAAIGVLFSVAVSAEAPPAPQDLGNPFERPPGVEYMPWQPIYWGPGTAYSAAVHAESDFLRAVGSSEVDLARARGLHADAYAKELENSQLAVKTYFDRIMLNRDFRRRLFPSLTERQERASELTKDRIEKLFHEVVKGDFTNELNWLMIHVFERRMAENAAFRAAVAGGDGLADLYPDQLRHLWLTDRPEGRGMVFRADNAVPLNEQWPRMLRDPSFDEARKRFEQARDAVLKQAKADAPRDFLTDKSLDQALAGVQRQFDQQYRSRLGQPGGPNAEEYAEAAGFLRTLRFQVYRLLKTSQQHDQYRFEGKQLTELVDHMGARGLYFARPKTGDEPVYQEVFFRLREIYERYLYPERSMKRNGENPGARAESEVKDAGRRAQE